MAPHGPEWVAVVILGVIEGITEFLPISSTGHLLLAENSHLLPQQSELFNVVIQAGAVLAVFLVFSRRVKDLLLNWGDPDTRAYLYKLIVAFGLTGAGGLVAKKLGFSLPKEIWPIAWATLFGGVLIVVIEWSAAERHLEDKISWNVAVAVGLAQLLAAVFPGTSRAGATILIAIALGLSRSAATEFSFLLGIPTLWAASGFEIYRELTHPAGDPTNWWMVGLGALVSTVVAFVVVNWIVRWVQTHTFVAFGWYRIALGGLMVALAYRGQ
jgi:undecaprenyl-diphosphatase